MRERVVEQVISSIILISSLSILLISQASHAFDLSFDNRIHNLMAKFTDEIRYEMKEQGGKKHVAYLDTLKIKIENCDAYPYHKNTNNQLGVVKLSEDIMWGLQEGLQCLAGQGASGALHSYHEYQALRLLKILESKKIKTFRCVQDETFAYAVANVPFAKVGKNKVEEITGDLPYPGVLMDTYRISGFVSDKHDEKTYRDFFKLDEQQIQELRTGKPVRLDTLAPYKNLAGLMFHEMIHWLGHEHSGFSPDITFLYDSCCFNGSEHISDAKVNEGFRKEACNILKDKELWDAQPYRQMRLWSYKGYDDLKQRMREHYD